MLITLRKGEYLPVLDEWVADPRFAEFVEILGQVLHHGDHAIHAAPLLLERLSQWPGLSRSQIAALRQMARDVSGTALPFDAVTDSLVLTGPAGPTEDPDRGIRWHRRDWTWLRDKGRLEPTCLGGENLDDAKWYLQLGRAWGARLRRSSSTAGSEVGLRPRGLGGNTARQEIPNAGAHGDPVLCILDSDRDHDRPTAELGGTAREATKAVAALPTGHLVHIEPLRARDVENILPLALVKEVAGTGTTWLEPMERRGFFARPGVDRALCYLDLGKVQCERRLLDTRDSSTRAYRAAALDLIRQRDSSCVGSTASCERITMKGQECGLTDPTGKRDWAETPPSCIVVHSVGKQLLPKIVLAAEERARARSTFHWLAELFPDEDPAVLDPARLAWSWGLRFEPRIRGAS